MYVLCKIPASEFAKNIGTVINIHLDMRKHVDYVCRGCYLHLRNISYISPNITAEAAANFIHAFISSKIDNLNSLLVGLPHCVLKKLQLIQNNAARLVLRKKRSEHVKPLLEQLHWLPIQQRITYKICLLTFKLLHGLAPP